MKKLIFLFALLTIAFLERIRFDLGPNIELVTTAMLLSSFYIGRKESFCLIFTVMALSDLIIGNTNIFIFTWSGFLIPAFLVSNLFKTKKIKGAKLIFTGTLAGISSTAFFYLWTNFGVWILSGMYPKNLFGLLQSYINALPFLRSQAISTLVFVPLGFTLTEIVIRANAKWQIEKRVRENLIFGLKTV